MELKGRKVKVVHIHAGVDLIGSKTSMAASKNVELTMTNEGIHMLSKGSNREVVIPFGNIKGFELFHARVPREHVKIDAPDRDETELPATNAVRKGRPPKTQLL